MFDARDVEDYRLAFEENRLLNIVACSRAKIWCPVDLGHLPCLFFCSPSNIFVSG